MNSIFKYRLYGRSKGRGKLNTISKEAIKLRLKKIERINYNVIDIGCGYGESTLEFARNNKKIVTACEKYIDGINNIAEKVHHQSLSNIYIFHGNVHELLDQYCSYDSIEEVWILFPDPWPKKRHFKRRLIDEVFLNKIKKFLKKNASIHIATDSKSYISEILKSIYEVKKDFVWINQNKQGWEYSSLSLPKTKYFKKALKNGLNPFYLKLVKL